jgi:hypothetical protein
LLGPEAWPRGFMDHNMTRYLILESFFHHKYNVFNPLLTIKLVMTGSAKYEYNIFQNGPCALSSLEYARLDNAPS